MHRPFDLKLLYKYTQTNSNTYPQETFCMVLFIIAKHKQIKHNLKQSNSPSLELWLIKLQYNHTMKFYVAIKKNEVALLVLIKDKNF